MGRSTATATAKVLCGSIAGIALFLQGGLPRPKSATISVLSHVLLGQIDKTLGICEPRHVQLGYHSKLPTLVKTSAKMASTNWECPMVPEQIQSVFPSVPVVARL